MRADADDFNPFEDLGGSIPFIPMNDVAYVDPYMVPPDVMAPGEKVNENHISEDLTSFVMISRIFSILQDTPT
jgi:hypothetical protein